jgi:hypothetical protein
MRPAREALILRRLLRAPSGELAPQARGRHLARDHLVLAPAQTVFHGHVFAGDGETAYVEMARAYFGLRDTRCRTHGKPSLVIHSLRRGSRNALGVVPLPLIEEPGHAWWAQLAPAGEKGPRIIAKLPIVSGDGPAAYVIGAIEQEPTGDDTTLSAARGSARARAARGCLLAEGSRASRARSRRAGRIAEKHVPTRCCSK